MSFSKGRLADECRTCEPTSLSMTSDGNRDGNGTKRQPLAADRPQLL